VAFRRHIRHVLANRDAVPAEFSASIPLAAHQKAADYTAAKTRLGMLETLGGAALLLGLTSAAACSSSPKRGNGYSCRAAMRTALH